MVIFWVMIMLCTYIAATYINTSASFTFGQLLTSLNYNNKCLYTMLAVVLSSPSQISAQMSLHPHTLDNAVYNCPCGNESVCKSI
jgi:hypothetical protein